MFGNIGHNMNEHDKLEIAEKFARDNLEKCCRELLEWRTGGILCDNAVRELADLCSFAGHSALAVAQDIITQEALEYIANANQIHDRQK